eukprot:950596-Prymnesium_polylepis.1
MASFRDKATHGASGTAPSVQMARHAARSSVPWLGSHHQVSYLPACSLTPETRGASGTAPPPRPRHRSTEPR